MRALVLREHGTNDVLRLENDYPTPTAGEDEVVLRVMASSVNYHDVFTRRGMPGITIPMPVVIGLDVAGEIVETGSGVTDWKVGDRVLVDPINRVKGGLMGETIDGGMAEYCRCGAHQLLRIPDAISYEEAAALPVAYGTAIRMMNTIGQVQEGEKVLILGASGGVGVCCVQLAKIAGAHVVACAGSEEKAARLRELGADDIIMYNDEAFMKAVFSRYGKPNRRRGRDANGMDVVVNFTGGDTWVRGLRCLKIGGRVLTCGATAGFDPTEDLRFIWTFELQIRGSNGWERDDLHKLFDLVESGRLKACIDRTFTLDDAADAVRTVEDRQVIGKVVVTP